MIKETLTKKFQDRVVSSLTMYFVELPSRRLAVIEEVYTHPEFRRMGYSTELIKKAIRRARELDAECIELTVRQDSPHIQEFYKSFGFEDRQQVAMRLKLKEMKPWNP